MSHRTTRKIKRKDKDQRQQKKIRSINNIPIQAPALKSLSYQSKNVGDDFYTWVNKKWLDKTSIPSFETDFGISEEVERLIFNVSKDILQNIKSSSSTKKEDIFLRTLANSCLHSRSQHTSVTLLKQIVHTLDCIKTKEDVVEHLGLLCKRRFPSLFIIQYTIDSAGKLQPVLDGNTPSLPLYFYESRSKFADYKLLLHKVGVLLDCPELEKVAPFEKSITFDLENLWSDNPIKTTGSKFSRKFGKIPWSVFFKSAGLENWNGSLYYKSPRWIRHVGILLHTIPLEMWKLLIARSYIIGSLKYLPPPFDELDFEFFKASAQGQKIKTPQMELFVSTVHTFLPDLFSRIFWEEVGSPEVEKEAKPFIQTLVKAAKDRLEETEWLLPETRKKAIHKVDKMRIEAVKPDSFPDFEPYELNEQSLLHNILLMGEKSSEALYKRLGHTYKVWEEGIYRVNAYYFNENNEIMIPYGTMVSPFYSSKASQAWNYGSLGSIVGHEMCHGFDEDGVLYDAEGQRKKIWSKSDFRAFHKKTKALIDLFNKQKVCNKHVNGKKTLSENIADLGGLGIALHALKEHLQKENKTKEEILFAYREFFTAFATSWRTLYREEKLSQSIETDRHSPAFLRVNMIVSQFDEWYEAFGITNEADLYRSPEERIRIF